MNLFFYDLLLIALAFLLHLIIWKIRLPKRQIIALVGIFLFVLILGTIFLFKFSGRINWNIMPSRNFFEIIQFILLFISIAAAYVVSYPAIEADSPTLVIIKAVSKAGSGGLDEDRLERMMNDDLLVIPRIKDMVSDKMVCFDGKRYKLTPKGIAMARVFLSYRNIIRGAKGG